MATIFRWVAAATVIFLVGFLGLWAMFTDQGPQESLLGRGLLVTIVYVLAGAAVGVLVPKRWYVAALSAWGPALMALLTLTAKAVHGQGPPLDARFLVLSLLIAPAVALASGILGKTVAGRRAASS